MGCERTKEEDFSIAWCEENMLSQMNYQGLLDSITSKGDMPVTQEQASLYRHLVGKMLYLGQMSAPLMLLHAFIAATRLCYLRIHHIQALASIVSGVKTKNATLRSVSWDHKDPMDCHFTINLISDVSMANKKDKKGRRAT